MDTFSLPQTAQGLDGTVRAPLRVRVDLAGAKMQRTPRSEFQFTADDAEPEAAAHAESRAGVLYRFLAPTRGSKHSVGRFSTARIEHWLNREPVLNVRLDTAGIRELMRDHGPRHTIARAIDWIPREYVN